MDINSKFLIVFDEITKDIIVRKVVRHKSFGSFMFFYDCEDFETGAYTDRIFKRWL